MSGQPTNPLLPKKISKKQAEKLVKEWAAQYLRSVCATHLEPVRSAALALADKLHKREPAKPDPNQRTLFKEDESCPTK